MGVAEGPNTVRTRRVRLPYRRFPAHRVPDTPPALRASGVFGPSTQVPGLGMRNATSISPPRSEL
jgi:hypothetical protein